MAHRFRRAGCLASGTRLLWSHASLAEPVSTVSAPVIEAAAAGDSLGARLVAGDFDGDGIDDLAVAAPGDDTTASGAGAVFFVYGADGYAWSSATLYGLVDDEDPSTAPETKVTVWNDADGDGFGDPTTAAAYCSPPAGTARNGEDCDDHDPAVNPAAEDIPGDGIDQDCDGADRASPGDTGDVGAGQVGCGAPVNAGEDRAPAGCGCGRLAGFSVLPMVPMMAWARRRRRGADR
jgi:hypothetical protein